MSFDFPVPDGTGSKNLANLINDVRSRQKPPIRNMAQKDAPAYITVVGYDESIAGDFNSSTAKFGEPTAISNKFFLQSIGEAQQEKSQILETFGEPLVLFFGERTRVYTLRGTFLDAKRVESAGLQDSVVYNWAAGFRKFYDERLRGTVLAEKNEIAILTVNDQVYMGYPTSLTINTDSRNPFTSSFTMSWVVISQRVLPPLQVVGAGEIDADADAFIERLENLYSVDSHFSGAMSERLEELEQDERRILADLLENKLAQTAAKSEDPAETAGDDLASLENAFALLERQRIAVQAEILDLILSLKG